MILMLFISLSASAEIESSRLPIIDVHIHVYAEDVRWDLKIPNPANGTKMTATNEKAHMQATFDEMERYNIVKVVAGNNYDVVLRWIEAAPHKIIGSFAFDSPGDGNLDFVRAEHKAGRLKSIGEVGIQYQGLSPVNPEMEPWYYLAEELDLPIAIHMGLTRPGSVYDSNPNYRVSLGNPLLLEDVLIRHPKLRVNVMHAGWPMIDDMIALMWAHPQVYVDTGVISWALPRTEFHRYLRRLVDAGFGERIMFGSDQMVWPDSIGLAVKGIESANFLSEKQKRDIFYNNAVRFFHLGEK